MNTKPTVSRYVERDKITVPPNTRAKADEEGITYKFTIISIGHYACESIKDAHIIIDKGGKIGCSCGDMTYRCTGTNVCKHIAALLDLKGSPQIPASGELIKKLILMGWVGGRDDLHPAELLKPAPIGQHVAELVSVECPHCKTWAKRETQEEADAWLVNHLAECPENPDNKSPKEIPKSSPPLDPLHEPEGPEYLEQAIPEIPDPPSEDYSNHRYLKTSSPSKPAPLNNVPPNLAAALCNMQKVDLLAVTDSNNPFHNAKYADLASVWAAIRKPLTDNGLAVIQTTEPYPGGVTVVTTLVHISGETYSSRLSCEVPKSKPDKNGQAKPNIQGLGSTITYLRRYSLAAMVGVAPVDDDGEAAMSR